jgi:hypothetical protein
MGSRRPPPSHRRDTLAQQGARRRSVTGRAVGDAAGVRPLLGGRLRLAQGRGEAQRAAAIQNRDRRGGHPLHPRQVASRERVAVDHDPWLAGLLVSPGSARAAVLPLAWLWPLLLWSALGSRENKHGTGETVFSAPRVRTRGTLTGVVVACLTASGVALNLALSGDASGFLALAAGALFVPAIAMACGVVSGGSTLFEGVYLPLWYLGPLNKVAALDFAASGSPGHPLTCIVLSVALGGVAFAARRRTK